MLKGIGIGLGQSFLLRLLPKGWSLLISLTICGIGFLQSFQLKAQASDRHEYETWASYINQIRVNERFSVWNDWQLITGTIALYRVGGTYHINPNYTLTGGYGLTHTSAPFTSDLIRTEHRPWWQIVGRYPLPKYNLDFSVRFRHDLRWREQFANGEIIQNEFWYNNRFRLQGRATYSFYQFENGGRLQADVISEVLYNAGGDVATGLDQNRLFLLTGYSYKGLSFLVGYVGRQIPPRGDGGTLYKHGLSFWVFQTIDLR